MGYLKNKLIKKKKLQRVSSSHLLIIPNNWIKEMDWDRTTILRLVWFPNENKIEVIEDKDEEVSKPITVEY